MYSSDGMKTLISMFKDYNKNIVFMDCQMYFFKYLFETKGNSIIFFRQSVELPTKTNRYWTTFETLA